MVAMKTPYINKKGVSPIIATLLLIVIAVAAAVVTYSFVMGITGTTTGTTIAQGQLTYDAYKVDKTGGNNYLLTAYIRNSGGKSVILNSTYLAGSAYTYNGSANLQISPLVIGLSMLALLIQRPSALVRLESYTSTQLQTLLSGPP
jgi:flagellin-like protein